MIEGRGFGLYVHWPFCQAKCPYCDFNSHVVSGIDQARWSDAFVAEIERVASDTGSRILNTIYFGGGTPSLMEPDVVGAVIDAARRAWTPANDMESTLEANPTSVEAGRFRGFRDAGVNRVSMGIQSLNDADLKALGRLHTVAEARAAFDTARSIFARASFDLIYARQNQTVEDWEKELTEALSMAADHLSLYQLTIEPGTAFGDRHARGGLRGLPNDDLAADMYELTQELTVPAGLPAYEISNHAVPGSEAAHNLIYWRSGDWAGVGPGAHGRLTLNGERIATETARMPGEWLAMVEQDRNGEIERSTVPSAEVFEETLMMGLRTIEGVSIDPPLRSLIIDLDSKINNLLKLDLIGMSDERLWVTPKGRPILNAVLRELLV